MNAARGRDGGLPNPLEHESPARRAGVLRPAALWCLTVLAASILYVATSDGQPQWQDSGEMLVRILTDKIEHPLGVALTHPLHFYLGRLSLWLMPGLEPALAITIGASAIPAAIGIANVALAIWIPTRRLMAVLPPTAALMLSHTYWQHATITECYGATMSLLGGELIALALYATTGEARWLLLMVLCNGLGISNHLLAGLVTPVNAALVLLAVRRGRLTATLAAAALALWLLGTLPYVLVASEHWRLHGDLMATLRSATVSGWAAEVTNLSINSAQVLLGAGYIVFNFPGLTVPLALAGLLWRKWPPVLRWALAAQLALFLLFAIRYPVRDAFAFFFPAYMVLTVLAGLGLERLRRSWKPRTVKLTVAAATITALWTPLVYWSATETARSLSLLPEMVQNKPYRDGYATFFLPWGCARNYGQPLNEEITRLVGTNGLVVIEDRMMLWSPTYGTITGGLAPGVVVRFIDLFHPSPHLEDDLEALRSDLRSYWKERRPVVLVPRDRDAPFVHVPGARWARHGDIYCLEHYADPEPSESP